jgi:protein TonB
MAMPLAAALAVHLAIAALLIGSPPRPLPEGAEWFSVELLPMADGAAAATVAETDVAAATGAADAVDAAPAPVDVVPAVVVPAVVAPAPARQAPIARAPSRRVAGGAVGGGASVASVPGPAPGASDDAVAAWKMALSAWIDRHRRYPPAARFRGEEGVVVLRFRVDAGGVVVQVALERGSGSSVLDAAAVALLTDARLPIPPPGLRPEQHSVSAPIRYRLQ